VCQGLARSHSRLCHGGATGVNSHCWHFGVGICFGFKVLGGAKNVSRGSI